MKRIIVTFLAVAQLLLASCRGKKKFSPAQQDVVHEYLLTHPQWGKGLVQFRPTDTAIVFDVYRYTIISHDDGVLGEYRDSPIEDTTKYIAAYLQPKAIALYDALDWLGTSPLYFYVHNGDKDSELRIRFSDRYLFQYYAWNLYAGKHWF